MKVTSESLFHFTNSLENLQNVLKNKFFLAYCKEKFTLSNQTYTNYFPMISFCDIPLSLAKDQIFKYGSYAIGMSKDWAIKNRLNPVLYVETNSLIAKDINLSREEFKKISDSFKNILTTRGKLMPIEEVKQIANSLGEATNHWLNTLRFIKNYRGTLVRDEHSYANYRFYDEREWRYVPEYNDTRIKPSIPKEEYLIYRGAEVQKPLIKEINIDFKAGDIMYLIVKSKEDIPVLIRIIKSTNNLIDNSDEADVLATCILTIEQIENDF